MAGGQIRLVEDGDALDVDDENELRKAINGLLGMQVDSATMTLNWFGGVPSLGCSAASGFQVFYTTASLATSIASATGTAPASAFDQVASCDALPCFFDNATSRWKPDTNAATVTIFNVVVLASSIPVGSTVVCLNLAGMWTVMLVIRCS